MPASKGYLLPEEVLSWFDVHFEPSDPNGRISLACRNAIGSMRQIYIGPPAKIRTILSEFRCKPRYDYYLSANGFTGMKRSSASLMILQNLVVDVDCHDRDLSVYDREDLLERFQGWFFKDALLDLPMPTSLVHTGRGLQLWWHLHPLPASRRELLAEILDFFLERIAFLLDDYETTRLTVDSAATRNLAGLFRLPGSTHSGTGARVRIERMPGDPVYDGEQLLALVRERKADLALDTEEKSGSFLWSRPPKVSLAGQYTPAQDLQGLPPCLHPAGQPADHPAQAATSRQREGNQGPLQPPLLLRRSAPWGGGGLGEASVLQRRLPGSHDGSGTAGHHLLRPAEGRLPVL